MAYQNWKHYCKTEKGERYLSEQICPDCGVRGTYDGWGYSVVEFMGMYAHGTGLAPTGPHRAFAGALFFPSFRACPKCGDRKIVETKDGDFVDCDACPRERYVFNGSAEERAAIRKQVLTAFPGYASPRGSDPVLPTTEPAPQPPPPANEPEPKDPMSPEGSPSAFLTPLPENQKTEDFARRIADAIKKAVEDYNNPQITDHRSKYTYLVKWWDKRGGTFYVKMDGIELRAISHPDLTLAVLFIESPFVASVIVDWELKNTGVTEAALKKYRKSIPRPEKFEIIRDAAYLPIDESFTQPMFDQLMDAMEELSRKLKS